MTIPLGDMMIDNPINKEIIEKAVKVGLPIPCENLFDAQMSFWLSLQDFMRTGGYNEVKKRMTFISEELANAIYKAEFRTIRNLCSGEISTMRPTVQDEEIIEILSSQKVNCIKSKMVLQVFGIGTL